MYITETNMCKFVKMVDFSVGIDVCHAAAIF